MTIRLISKSELDQAVDVFTEAFADDPLYVLAFPDMEQRLRLTRLVYEFAVNDWVSGMNLKLIGAFYSNILAGALIYSSPEAKEWTAELGEAVEKMRQKANDPAMDLIGEYARTSTEFRPKEPHFFFNEMAVRKTFRKRGIATGLVMAVEEECKKHPLAQGIAFDTSNKLNMEICARGGYKIMHSFNFHELTVYSMYKKISKP